MPREQIILLPGFPSPCLCPACFPLPDSSRCFWIPNGDSIAKSCCHPDWPRENHLLVNPGQPLLLRRRQWCSHCKQFPTFWQVSIRSWNSFFLCPVPSPGANLKCSHSMCKSRVIPVTLQKAFPSQKCLESFIFQPRNVQHSPFRSEMNKDEREGSSALSF